MRKLIETKKSPIATSLIFEFLGLSNHFINDISKKIKMKRKQCKTKKGIQI
jgi:hypothetical protein